MITLDFAVSQRLKRSRHANPTCRRHLAPGTLQNKPLLARSHTHAAQDTPHPSQSNPPALHPSLLSTPLQARASGGAPVEADVPPSATSPHAQHEQPPGGVSASPYGDVDSGEAAGGAKARGSAPGGGGQSPGIIYVKVCWGFVRALVPKCMGV